MFLFIPIVLVFIEPVNVCLCCRLAHTQAWCMCVYMGVCVLYVCRCGYMCIRVYTRFAHVAICNLSLVEISKLCMEVSNSFVSVEFYDSVVESVLQKGGGSNRVCVHILDRIAASGTIPKRLDELVDSLLVDWKKAKFNSIDFFLANRALSLLGYSPITQKIMCDMSISNKVQLARLSQTPVSLNFKDLNVFSTFDLIQAVLTHTSDKHSPNNTCGIDGYKRIATELVRRIELRAVSPHSCALLIQRFSNVPIQPNLLQACFAFLLEAEHFRVLTENELACCLHAMALCEIENIILVREIVIELVARGLTGNLSTQNNRRILNAISDSKSWIPPEYVFSLTRGGRDASLGDSASSYLNLLMNGGLCMKAVDSCLRSATRFLKKLDLVDLGSLALLNAARIGLASPVHVTHVSTPLCKIPESALEITEKSNSALPKSDLKKKRLAKRVQKRAENMFDCVEWPECTQIVRLHTDFGTYALFGQKIYSEIASRDLAHMEESTRRDILESIHFCVTHGIAFDCMRDLCVGNFFSKTRKLPMEERRKDETSVAKCLTNLGFNVKVGTVNSIGNRVGVLL